MPSRSLRAFLAILLSPAAVVAAGTAVAGVAAASVARPAAGQATPACLILPNCVSVYQFGWPGSSQLVLEPIGEVIDSPVVLNTARPADPGQDWTYIDLGPVSSYRAGKLPDIFGLNGFDFATYGNGELFQLEFSPAGHPSGLCAANVANRMVLRICNGSRFQTMIATNVIPGTPGSADGYFYVLSAARARIDAQHMSVTGSFKPGVQVAFVGPLPGGHQSWQTG